MPQVYALQAAPYDQNNSFYKRECNLPVIATAGSGNGTYTLGTNVSASGFTITRTGVGTHTGTMPKAARGAVLSQVVFSGATNEKTVCFTAFDTVAGTFAFTTFANSAAADFADGAKLFLFFTLEGG
jgi:hypothetical protein